MITAIKKFIKKNQFLYFNLITFRHFLLNIIRSKASFRQKMNYLKIFRSARNRSPVSTGKPVMLTIEPSSYCNLRCPICETGNGSLPRKNKNMSLKDFKFIVDQFDENLKEIYFYFMGESFLNKEAYEMIRYVRDRGIYVGTCTNGDVVNPEKLITSGLNQISFQIGGMTQKTHETYRVNSNLKRVQKNLEETLKWKQQYGSDIEVDVGFILMKHNEHEVEAFKEYCRGLGDIKYQIIGSTVRNLEEAEKYLPSLEEYQRFDMKQIREGKIKAKKHFTNYCGWIYSTVTITVNGDVLPCCYDANGRFKLGNVFEENIYKIWNNEKYRQLRKNVATRQDQFLLCDLCKGESISRLL